MLDPIFRLRERLFIPNQLLVRRVNIFIELYLLAYHQEARLQSYWTTENWDLHFSHAQVQSICDDRENIYLFLPTTESALEMSYKPGPTA